MSDTAPAVRITVVTAPACHLCGDAIDTLRRLASRYPLDVTILDITNAEGRRLVEDHRAPMSPLVIVDGELFSWGRLPRRKLEKLLDSRRAAEAV